MLSGNDMISTKIGSEGITSLLTPFLSGPLPGIDCPRGARTTKEGAAGVKIPGDAYAEEALQLAKEHCMHREVSYGIG